VRTAIDALAARGTDFDGNGNAIKIERSGFSDKAMSGN
jgi:hypothetical protein